ncbi:MAG: alpha-glucosidase, partial [Nocardioidaceae bacterium]
DEDLRDPTWQRSGGTERGRDGARVPLPWTTAAAGHHGFAPDGTAATWLPQPEGWGDLSVQAQRDRRWSPLAVVRSALAARGPLRDAPLPTWLADEGDVLAFRRGDVTCVLGTGDEPLSLARWGDEVVASSRPVDPDGRLPSPGCAWLR